MLKWFIRNRLAAFERDYKYDMGYAREILDTDLRAFLAFAKVNALSKYRRDVPREVVYAAKLVGTMIEDCGPCTQLMVTMALREGVDPTVISAIVRDDLEVLDPGVRLAIAFAKASLAHAPEADAYREQIVATWGPRALVSIAFALTSARVFPTMKYALGFGKACQRIVVAGSPIAVVRAVA